ncbi:MAG: ion channel [Candidatus Latescibacterota bacterium]
MIHRIARIRKRIYESRIWRLLFRNTQVRWLFLLSLLLILLMIMIAIAEEGVNDGFHCIWDSLYWAVVTLASVGYGDIVPRGHLGRVLTIPFIIISVVLMSFMTATIASILTASRIREGRGLQKINFQRHVVICGSNSHIDRVISGIISASGRAIPDIVLINSQPESANTTLVERFPEATVRFVSGDYTTESTLLRAAVDKASAVIIMADSGPEGQGKPDDRTLIAALAIKSLSRHVEICAELLDAANEVHLRRAGVDQIVFSGEFSGFLLSSSVMTPGITQALREMMRIDRGNAIRRLPFPREMQGNTFHAAALAFLEHDGSILLGVITERKTFNMEDLLTGDNNSIDDFIRRKFSEAGRNLEIETKGRLTVTMNPGRDYRITGDDFAVVLATKGRSATI